MFMEEKQKNNKQKKIGYALLLGWRSSDKMKALLYIFLISKDWKVRQFDGQWGNPRMKEIGL